MQRLPNITIRNFNPRIFGIRSFRILLIVFLMSNLQNSSKSQSYEKFENSYNFTNRSLEVIVVSYDNRLRDTRKYLDQILKEKLSSNVLTELITNYYILKKQLKYIEDSGYKKESIRICSDKFILLTKKKQEDYLKFIHTIEDKFSISDVEYEIIKELIEKAKSELKTELFLKDIDKFEEYIDLAFNSNYTKLEIFRDFTGYWIPDELLDNNSLVSIVTKFWNWRWDRFKKYYRNPLGYTYKIYKHGLIADEAIRRLIEVTACKEQNQF